MEDFNNDILHNDTKVSEYFLDKMCSMFFLNYIASPSPVTSRSKTLIDDIFWNDFEEDTNQVTSPLLYVITILNLHFSKINNALK